MDDDHTDSNLDLSSLRPISVLGRGAKGVVFLVLHEPSSRSTPLALKAISRSRLIKNKSTTNGDDSYRRIWFERDVLSSLRHPLLPSLRSVVSTDRVIGFLIDYCPGGNLTDLRRKQTEHMFSDDIIRFYAAELVLALDHLHQQQIVYRDLKPENILIQESGHIMLVDFDLSVKLPTRPGPISTKTNPHPVKKPHRRRRRLFSCIPFSNSCVSPEMSDPTTAQTNSASSVSGKSNSFVGTEEYVAPEIISGSGHDYAVDWWGLGVVMYEMLYGKTPFRGQNRKETFYRVLSMEPELVGEKTALRDLIGKLLEKDPAKRVGVEAIKGHQFFTGLDWESVLTVERTPFVPGGAEWEEMEKGAVIDVEDCVEQVFGVNEEGFVSNTAKSGDFGVF